MSGRLETRRADSGVLAIPRWVLAAVFVTLGFLFVTPLSHAVDSSAVSSVEGPVQVDTSILVTELSGVNVTPGTFNATFYVSMQCPSPCNRTDWDILNAVTYTKQTITETADETWWLVSGTFTYSPDLRLFPFDTQNLSIKIEDRLFGAESLVFVPEISSSEVVPEVRVPGWDREPFTFTSSTTTYQSLRADYSRLEFTVPLSRSTIASITKYFLPLLIFVCVSIATLMLSRFEVQIATAAAGLVGVTVFYLTTGTTTGSVGYLTLWDLSVLVVYLVLGLVLLCGVIGVRRTDAEAFAGSAGAERKQRLRRTFLTITICVVTVGIISLIAFDALT